MESIHEKRKHADNSELMAQNNEIVSGYVGVTKTDTDDYSKKFDISNIDFDRLRKAFEKAQNKNMMFKDLQDIVEERLLRMMKNNPLRIITMSVIRKSSMSTTRKTVRTRSPLYLRT